MIVELNSFILFFGGAILSVGLLLSFSTRRSRHPVRVEPK